ncbi:hypothetical protein VFPPC_14858 [Pochonia chlamydosporia 170]|uniref:Uncharacterized protein n=1 Tax=Pochonia chlamydosporia 170 TaxID=1380566 RepID=A0A179F156_METCM|nr:hypothetical protein VFPPC_14858 [Pochonia chlamydosporia 170]OAQ58803.1 hypothetical protein VFPPC_14858 [Pochonia chlamydosporia 170]
MFQQFQFRHIPALIAGSTMAFGGLWPMFNARAAMLEFGLPPRVANTPAAAPVMIVGNVRTTIIGTLILLFYFRQQLDVVDTFLAVTGAYAGLVDSYVVWKEGSPSKATFRLISSWLIAAWGIFGMTAGR